MKVCLILYLVVVVLFLVVVYSRRKEGFAIGLQNFRLCSTIDTSDKVLFPKSVVFVIQGYNYTDTPIIYRGTDALVPMQYFWDSDGMTYYLMVSAPRGLCNEDWTILTSENVKPIVIEGYSQTYMRVSRRSPQPFNKGPSTIVWNVTC